MGAQWTAPILGGGGDQNVVLMLFCMLLRLWADRGRRNMKNNIFSLSKQLTIHGSVRSFPRGVRPQFVPAREICVASPHSVFWCLGGRSVLLKVLAIGRGKSLALDVGLWGDPAPSRCHRSNDDFVFKTFHRPHPTNIPLDPLLVVRITDIL